MFHKYSKNFKKYISFARNFTKIMPDNSNNIVLRGVRVHNLKSVNLDLPQNKLIVITGLSGSGKSSLAFDTLFAEGQRRYVESLSSYARQFLGRMDKPDVDLIEGIAPAIAIKQQTNTRNPRSTVGTSTEIYDYLKLLYARIGKTYSPISGNEVKRHEVKDVLSFFSKLVDGTKVLLCFDYYVKDNPLPEQIELLSQQGFGRLFYKDTVIGFEDFIVEKIEKPDKLRIVFDRLKVRNDDQLLNRLADSVESVFFEGRGECVFLYYDESENSFKEKIFTNRYEADGLSFETPIEHLFSFNNPVGACRTCEGFGQTLGIDPDLVIPNKNLSIYEEAIVCWKGEKMQEWKEKLIMAADKFDFPIHKPYYKLTDEQKDLLWTGNEYFWGLNEFFSYLEENKYKIQYRVMLSRYRGKTICPDCKGKRLRKEAYYVKIDGKNIGDLVDMPIVKLRDYFRNINLDKHSKELSKRILNEINNRLSYLCDVGLEYLTLNRTASSLSGGESQRINLASSLGSSLVGSMYILDEPSIGLHPRDTNRLVKVLKQLRDENNTVIVVEHEEEIIRAADYIVDIGPGAGMYGGEIMFSGNLNSLLELEGNLTADYLSGRKKLNRNKILNKWNSYVRIEGARQHNLKNIDVNFPLGIITAITGVSGSGKTTLIKNVLYPAIKKRLGVYGERSGEYNRLTGDVNMVNDIVYVDQNPIGKSSRSNPATYIKAWDEIRKLFASQKLAATYGFKPSHFSFNIDGGRCEECLGEGEIKVEMQFMADVYLKCEACNGRRFKDDVLDVKYHGKNVYDFLEMTVEEAIQFLSDRSGKTEQNILKLLKHYQDVGLSYLKLGQSSSTLSGGESQRVKLASFLSSDKAEPTIFVFDEPTTGLHFDDIKNLLKAFEKLQQKNHTLIIIEHNAEIIKNADWIIDLGPEGGDKGGYIVFEGTIDDLVNCKNSYTGKYLKNKI